MYLLIHSINTLTYLIELNADLQTAASFLEQIIPTLAVNVLEAYSMQTINKIQLSNLTSKKLPSLQPSPPTINSQARKKSTNSEEQINTSTEPKNQALPANNTNREVASLYSMFYLNYDQYSLRALQFKLHEHQYHQLTTLDSTEYTNSKLLYRINRSLSLLDKTVHKRLASVCLHALSAMAANNEENRRQITENSSLVCRLIDSIQLGRQGGYDLTDEESTEFDNGGEEQQRAGCFEWEEAFKRAEMIGIPEEIDRVLSEAGCRLAEGIDESDEDLINGLDEDFDDYNETDADVLRLSGLCLLHSLSRSVHQLRTKFLDRKIWMPIIELIKKSRRRRLERRLLGVKLKQQRLVARQMVASEGDVDVEDMDEADANETMDGEGAYLFEMDSLNDQNLLSVTTAILANLLLEFSPSKEVKYFYCYHFLNMWRGSSFVSLCEYVPSFNLNFQVTDVNN